MPIYSYECGACRHSFEEFVKMSDCGKAQKCPKCGKKEAKKVIKGAASIGASSGSAANSCGGGTSRFR